MSEDMSVFQPLQPRRAEGSLELRVWGATQEQLADGLAAARAVLERRGLTAGRAIVCQSALTAYEFDSTLPQPDAETEAGAQACREAYVAAVTAAGGDIESDEDALAFDQGEDGRPLWNSIPTLKAYRAKLHAELSEPDATAPRPLD